MSVNAYDRIGEALSRGDAVLLDGPNGSELVDRGVRWRWHGLRTDADAVQALHEEYIAAGADVIRTDTFQLNRRLYLNVFRDADHMRHIGAPGLETRARDLTAKAVEVALAARRSTGRPVAIAGVMAPLEHCYRPDLSPPAEQAREEHWEIASWLADGGVDCLILESMNTVDEAEAAADAAAATGLPVWASFVLGPEGEILGGEPLSEGVRAAEAHGAKVVLANCAPPEAIGSAIRRLREAASGPVGGFAQIGRFDPPSWKFEFHPQFRQTGEWPPERYAKAVEGWVDAGARVVGGCCGTGPEHTRALRRLL